MPLRLPPLLVGRARPSSNDASSYASSGVATIAERLQHFEGSDWLGRAQQSALERLWCAATARVTGSAAPMMAGGIARRAGLREGRGPDRRAGLMGGRDQPLARESERGAWRGGIGTPIVRSSDMYRCLAFTSPINRGLRIRPPPCCPPCCRHCACPASAATGSISPTPPIAMAGPRPTFLPVYSRSRWPSARLSTHPVPSRTVRLAGRQNLRHFRFRLPFRNPKAP